MSATLENTSVKYSDLISEIETGQVKIPTPDDLDGA